MVSDESVTYGKYTAEIIDVEVSENVRFGRYIANVYKPVYSVRVNGSMERKTVKDNGVFRYKKVEGSLYSAQKNWGYAKFLKTMKTKNINSIVGELVSIEVYEKTFNNSFSKRVQYPVAKILNLIEVPF